MIFAAIILLAFFVGVIVAFDVWAQGTDRASGWPLMTYVWVGAWAAIGGLVSFYQKVRAGKARWFNLSELAGELFTSAFVGIVSGLLCEAAGFNTQLTWGLVAISGHAGGRAIFWLEQVTQKTVEQRLGVTTTTPAEPPPAS